MRRYRHRVSGPLLDRIDLHVQVPALGVQDLRLRAAGAPTASLRPLVLEARRRQAERYGRPLTNAEAPAPLSPVLLRPGPGVEEQLLRALHDLGFSARAHAKVWKIARTIADLEGVAEIAADHIAEALGYRGLDREGREEG